MREPPVPVRLPAGSRGKTWARADFAWSGRGRRASVCPMTTSRTIFARLTVTLIGVLALAGVVRAQHKASDVPVDFGASVSVTGPLGTEATSMKVHIDK